MSRLVAAVGVVWTMFWANAAGAQHADVLLQVVDGKIGVGIADFDNEVWTLGGRVFGRELLSNFRTNDPGFTSLATGNALLGPGIVGFPSRHNVSFDLLPMRVGTNRSNLFYWDGADLSGDGLSLADVRFVRPAAGITWNILDDKSNLFTANGGELLVPGGLIQQSSSDTNPEDGIDTGAIHSHLLMRVDDGDANTLTTPPQGVYMVALRARADGFENSEPFLLVHRSSALSNQVRDLAAEWADENYLSLFAPPGDYDQNGTVDGTDFLRWQAAFGINGTSPADGNGDGSVNGADFALWSENFGSNFGATVLGSAVPEPTTGGLVVLLHLVTGLSATRRRRINA